MKAADVRALQAAAMTEEDLEEKIRDLCTALGVVRVHHLRSRGTHPGWPDLVLIGTRILYQENKTQKGRVSPAQLAMHAALRAAGADVDVWRPEDLLSGRIRAELCAIAGVRVTSERKPA